MATEFPSCDAALLLYDDMTCEVDMHMSLIAHINISQDCY